MGTPPCYTRRANHCDPPRVASKRSPLPPGAVKAPRSPDRGTAHCRSASRTGHPARAVPASGPCERIPLAGPLSFRRRSGSGSSPCSSRGEAITEPRINDRIRVPEVRLVGPEGEQVGIVPIGEALRLAQDSELDLVEVAPMARPPVAKLMDYGK